MMHETSKSQVLGRSWLEWLSSLPIFAMLVLTLVIGTGEMVHGQLLKLGESMFGDSTKGVQYFMLRADPQRPTCNPQPDVDAEVQRQVEAAKARGQDDIDALFGDAGSGPDPAVIRQSVISAAKVCTERHAMFERIAANISPEVKVYRTIETSFFGLFQYGTDNRTVILLVMVAIAAVTTTLGFHHIAIRSARYRRDYLVQSWTQVIANGLLLFSSIRYYQISRDSGIPIDRPLVHYLWMAMFTVLLLINLKRAFRLPAMANEQGEGNWKLALLCTPLYAFMAINAGSYFLSHGHDSGLAIYVNQMMELPTIFLNLALFVWAGMLLKQSRVVDLFMNLARPWKLSPEMLTYIILLASALPTAYTGASGIFVIAAGAIIYHEIRAVGGTRQFALASTAMSGSLGVVLRPCLLVVLIAALNKQVTTNQLYDWGVWVFFLTSTVFLVMAQIHRTTKVEVASPLVAIPGMLRQVPPILPYVAVVVVIALIYEHLLDTKLNEITAPTIMPVMLILVVIFDKLLMRRSGPEEKPVYATHRQDTVEGSIRVSTNETVGHIGALITLMALSMASGGVIERSEVLHLAPQHFGSDWMAMLFLTLFMVFVGMVMDPLGAIFLVSSTLAPIAYANGIDPVHFWMMVLVAFELGYLTPPVALNQLLMRQVVGDDEVNTADDEVRHKNFFRRYERWILPTVVMSISLLLVAYLPLVVKHFEVFAPVRNWFAQ